MGPPIAVPPELMARYLELLHAFVAIPSVSTEPNNPVAVTALRAAADWVTQTLDSFATSVEIIQPVEDGGMPIVAAHVDAGADATAVIYGHYDVQSAPETQRWSTPGPFVPTERDGRIYGRGAADNKGQMLMHVAVAEHLAAEHRLGMNLLFLVEGEEEIGSATLRQALVDGRTPQADWVLISDATYDREPALEMGVRGGFNARLVLETASSDPHSGSAGGAILNAAVTLAHVVTSLIDKDGVVLVPGFYDAVPEDLVDEPDDPGEARRHAATLNANELTLANARSYAVQVGRYPTLQVSGFASGFVGEAFMNIVPGRATAQFNARTVVGQDARSTWKAVLAAAQAATPSNATLRGELGEHLEAVALDPSSPWAVRATASLTAVLGHAPRPVYSTGGLPMLNDLVGRYGSVVSIGLANRDARAHGGDENIMLEAVDMGLRCSLALLRGD